jgi:hypothetical protein
MSTPTLPEIRHHEAVHGGLWRAVPVPQSGKQPRPSFFMLTIGKCDIGPVARCDGGDLAGTLDDKMNAHLRGAEWIPVDSRGEKLR